MWSRGEGSNLESVNFLGFESLKTMVSRPQLSKQRASGHVTFSCKTDFAYVIKDFEMGLSWFMCGLAHCNHKGP